METAPVSTTPSAAPAATGSAAPTTSAAASTAQPNMTVSNGAPGTSSATPPNPGAASGKWYDSFDAETKDYITQKGFQDTKSVVDSYRNLEKLRGVPQDQLLKLPDPKAGADAPEWNDVYNKLGKPATPEGYNLKPSSPEGASFTDWAKSTFHKLNLTATQGQEIVKQFTAFSDAQAKQMGEQHVLKVNEQAANLQKEWGAAYDQNIGRAKAAYRQLGIPDAAIDSLETTLGFDGVMKMFNKLGSQIGEHQFVGGDPNQSFGEGSILAPADAKAAIERLKKDPDFAAKYVKGDVKARQQMARLHEQANPT